LYIIEILIFRTNSKQYEKPTVFLVSQYAELILFSSKIQKDRQTVVQLLFCPAITI